MRKLSVLSMLLLFTLLFCAGNDRMIYIGIADSVGCSYDFGSTALTNVSFKAWINTRESEILADTSFDSGFESSGDSVSYIYLNVGNFPTDWSPGNLLKVWVRDKADSTTDESWYETYADIPLNDSNDTIFVGLDNFYGTGHGGDPLMVNTPANEPIRYFYLGAVDNNIEAFDFSSAPYDNVKFTAFIPQRPTEVIKEDSPGSGYEDFDSDASAVYFDINDFDTEYESGDQLRVIVKQQFPDGYLYAEYNYTLDEWWMSEYILCGLDLWFGSGCGGAPVYVANWIPDTGINDNNLAKEMTLSQNYPNPFNPETEISFSLPKEEQVTLSVFNSEGQLIKELVNGKISAGNHSINFNGENLNSGIYFYTLETASSKLSKKMLLIK